MKLRFVVVSLFIFPLTVLGGWKSPPSFPLPTYCQPELPYLLSQPYSSLYIEVDRMEGVDIPKEAFDELKEFLSKYCKKPDGIEIVYDDIIPQSGCKNRSAGIIANLFIDGPPPRADNKQSVYLYVLIYDSTKMGQQSIKTPHVSFPYACAIYYDINIVRIIKNRVARNLLLHEAGHVLGLCKNTAHGDGAHCKNKGCVMIPKIKVSITGSILHLPMNKLDLCKDCQKDIETMQAANPVSNMSFNGPFLVRQEDGYWVASLPVCDVVSFSGTDTFDWCQMLTDMKKYVKDYESSLQNDSHSRLRNIMPYTVGDLPQDINDAFVKLARAEKDPNPSVKIGAKETIKKLKAALKTQSNDVNNLSK